MNKASSLLLAAVALACSVAGPTALAADTPAAPSSKAPALTKEERTRQAEDAVYFSGTLNFATATIGTQALFSLCPSTQYLSQAYPAVRAEFLSKSGLPERLQPSAKSMFVNMEAMAEAKKKVMRQKSGPNIQKACEEIDRQAESVKHLKLDQIVTFDQLTNPKYDKPTEQRVALKGLLQFAGQRLDPDSRLFDYSKP